MDNRREFLKKTLLLSGAAGMATLPPSILKALSIDPDAGSTYLDAEHIVILMQENRSFDHVFGTLRGVRGYNDPRAITLPNKNKVWLQTSAKGETYAPFRLDIKNTKITWMGSLPHSRKSQTGARNDGRYDNWIEAKKSEDVDYADLPLTMGYYTRKDIPFYYALADSFTVCDQHFCSSLTPTDPNRLYFWSGTVRAKLEEDSRAFIDNDDIEKGVEWRTFPELLEQHNVSWKIYQNELSVDGGFTEEEDEWLSNFADNSMEFFNQYNVKLSKRYIDYLPEKIAKLEKAIEDLQTKAQSLPAGSKDLKDAQKYLRDLEADLTSIKEDLVNCTTEKFESLSAFQKIIHEKAFAVNSGDPYQHELTPLDYLDGDIQREINIPKGDVLHRFRQDVQNKALPTVSWLVAPETFSDCPGEPWIGAWYLSEVMDILTQNPEVWKKTIFILTYDENDGYFDHVPPFTAPDYRVPESGQVSDGIDTRLDHVKLEKDIPGSIGLGFRVPMIIASPWSRGGLVNSQVFDHTSCIQFVEHFINKKFGKNIKETNITPWRRTVCGDLTSVFRQFKGDKIQGLPFIKKDPFIESLHKAKFKNVPSDHKPLSPEEIKQINSAPEASPFMQQQEKGIRTACAIPYEIYADGNYHPKNKTFEIITGAGNHLFKDSAAGCPFIVYARNYRSRDFSVRNYAVTAGDRLADSWQVPDFDNHQYHLQVYGPNGFFREFKGNDQDPYLDISVAHLPNGNAAITFKNTSSKNIQVEIASLSYHHGKVIKEINAQENVVVVPFDLTKSFAWYDFSIKVPGNYLFEKRFAGHVETGRVSKSDPAMS